MSPELHLLSWAVGAIIGVGLVILAPKVWALLRKASGDKRVAKNWLNIILCPKCNSVLAGIYPKGVFHDADVPCPDAGRPHFHWACEICGTITTVKP